MNVDSPDRAGLIAHLVARTLKRPISGTVEIVVGVAHTYVVGDTVTDKRPDRIDAVVEAPLSVLASVAAGGPWLGHFLAGRLKRRGSLGKALEVLRAVRR